MANRHKEYYKKNKEKIESRRRKQLAQKKQIKIKEHGEHCAFCGYNKYCVALEFHHVENNNRKDNRVNGETDKCILICSNCHQQHHVGGGIPYD